MKPPAALSGAGGVTLVGPVRFELTTSRPPDGRANQAALRPDEADTYPVSLWEQAGKRIVRVSGF